METKQDGDVQIVDTDQEAPIVRYQDLTDVIQLAEKRVGYMDRVKTLALKVTNNRDWLLTSGKHGPVPYLQGAGVEKVARLFGVKITGLSSERMERTTPDGREYYIWEWMGTAELPGGIDYLEAFGARSSLDLFFQMQEKDARTGADGRTRPPVYIDEADVKKAAYNNLLVNAVTRLLGLRNLSIEMLEEAGLDPTQMQGVEYAGSDSTEGGEGARDFRKDLVRLITEIAGPGNTERADLLEAVTAFAGHDGPVKGKRSFSHVSSKAAEVTYGRLSTATKDGQYIKKYTPEGKPLEGGGDAAPSDSA